jgi:hypothetical protein
MMPDKALTHICSLSFSLRLEESMADPLGNKVGATFGAPFEVANASLLLRVISFNRAYSIDVAVCGSSLSGLA